MSDDLGVMLPVWNDPVTLLPVHVMTEFAVSISAPKAVELKRNRAVKKRNLGHVDLVKCR